MFNCWTYVHCMLNVNILWFLLIAPYPLKTIHDTHDIKSSFNEMYQMNFIQYTFLWKFYIFHSYTMRVSNKSRLFSIHFYFKKKLSKEKHINGFWWVDMFIVGFWYFLLINIDFCNARLSPFIYFFLFWLRNIPINSSKGFGQKELKTDFSCGFNIVLGLLMCSNESGLIWPNRSRCSLYVKNINILKVNI